MSAGEVSSVLQDAPPKPRQQDAPNPGETMLRQAKLMDDPHLATPCHLPLLAALAVTAMVTALSWLLPTHYAATGVGLGFLGATWWLVLRGEEEKIRHYGLALGGIFEGQPLKARRLLREGGLALAQAALAALIVFPPFVAGYCAYWHPRNDFHFKIPPTFADDLLGQLLVIALPEEAFFRGYLQTALDVAWPPRWRLLGATVGPSLLVTSAIFAVGHLLTEPSPSRLAVFFPSLLFGWMRARTGGIGAPTLFHAACNIFVSFLAHGFGFTR
ncbi:MAG: MrtC family glutamic-type intramembrane protease [Myxococcales bacterium]|nr:MrtC family glutamic-type intramembrane protease [Polyangiaceae bacterium]MDW8251555.1 MrtC family glutamic-type intramembrane protease [Myxococcales bacterium]